jgi:hypothetical protein
MASRKVGNVLAREINKKLAAVANRAAWNTLASPHRRVREPASNPCASVVTYPKIIMIVPTTSG